LKDKEWHDNRHWGRTRYNETHGLMLARASLVNRDMAECEAS